MNIHRINWLWANKRVLDDAGITELPKTWAEFNADCDKIVASGKICMAHLSADWSDATPFEVIVYGQDLDLFKKAFVEADVDALRSEGMVKAFEQLRTMVSKYMDPAIAGRDYDATSTMMASGKAGFFIMGDWEIGTLQAAGDKPERDYLCGQAPTDWGKPGFILNADSVVFFTQKDPEYIEGQTLLAQHDPVAGVPDDLQPGEGLDPGAPRCRLSQGFNPASRLSQKDLQASIEDGTLVRSMAHNMTVLQKYRGAMMETITEFVNTPDMSAADAANAMADNVEAQM